MKRILFLIGLALVQGGVLSASTVTLLLDHPNWTALPGDSVTWSGTLSYVAPDGDPQWIGVDTVSLTPDPDPLFGTYFPEFEIYVGSLRSGNSIGSLRVATFTVDPGATLPGQYTGQIRLVYDRYWNDPSSGLETPFDSVSPFIDVNVGVSTVPEPGSFGLMAGGALLVAAFARRRWLS